MTDEDAVVRENSHEIHYYVCTWYFKAVDLDIADMEYSNRQMCP